MTRNERTLKAVEKTMAEKAHEIEELWAKENDDYTLSEDERAQVLEHVKALEELKVQKAEAEANIDLEQEVKKAGQGLRKKEEDEGGITDVTVRSPSPQQIKSLGDQFIESKGYKRLLEGGMEGQHWSSGPVELKATLAETPGTALTPPAYTPGVVETLFQRNYVSDAFAQVPTTASQILYVSETTATNAAAAVAEGQAKPQSTLVFAEVAEPVRKIATILPVTDEMLADAPQVQAYVNSRLILFVKNTEENQILTGSGVAPNIAGILGVASRTTVGTFTRSAGTSNERALFMAMNGTRGSSQLDPDLIVMHPTNWQTTRLGTDSAGQYLLGGPGGWSYGGPTQGQSSSQFSSDSLWGVPVVVTSNIPLGTALVGNFKQGGAVYRRQGITVEATNSHSTWFADNITAIRAEERLALALYRPQAFTAVIGLN